MTPIEASEKALNDLSLEAFRRIESCYSCRFLFDKTEIEQDHPKYLEIKRHIQWCQKHNIEFADSFSDGSINYSCASHQLRTEGHPLEIFVRVRSNPIGMYE